MTRRLLLAMLAALAGLRKPKLPRAGTVFLDANGNITAMFYRGKWHRNSPAEPSGSTATLYDLRLPYEFSGTFRPLSYRDTSNWLGSRS